MLAGIEGEETERKLMRRKKRKRRKTTSTITLLEGHRGQPVPMPHRCQSRWQREYP